MNHSHGAPIGLILFIIACVLLFFAAFPWTAVEPYRIRIGWAGMFFWAVSTFFA